MSSLNNKTYPIYRVCTACKQEKYITEFRYIGRFLLDGTRTKEAKCRICKQESQRDYLFTNRDRLNKKAKIRMKNLILKDPIVAKEKRWDWRRKGKEELADWYVKKILFRERIKGSEIPIELVRVKRELMKLKRELKRKQ